MKKMSCAFEKEVLAGLRTGVLTPAAKEHVQTCTVCRESIAIQHWMNDFHAAALPKARGKKLPDVESIWIKSKKAYATPTLCPNKKLEKKALIPLLFPQVLAYAAVIIVIIYFLILNLPGIKFLLETKLELQAIITSFFAIFKAFFKSASYFLISIAVGLSIMTIFMIAAAFDNKTFHRSKQYIF